MNKMIIITLILSALVLSGCSGDPWNKKILECTNLCVDVNHVVNNYPKSDALYDLCYKMCYEIDYARGNEALLQKIEYYNNETERLGI